MTNYRITFHPRVKSHLRKIPSKWQEKIKIALNNLSPDPYQGNQLKGEKFSGVYSYRVWRYRILYEIFKNQLIIYIIDIDHRKKVYL